MPRITVAGSDVLEAVALTAAALRRSSPEAWTNAAGPLDMDCWETLEHLHNGLFSYALRLSRPGGWTHGEPTIVWDREGALALPILFDRAEGPGAGADVLEMVGGMVAALADVREPPMRSSHAWGLADPEGYAAMGVVETILHGFDLTQGLGVAFEPPAPLAAKGLARLFPEAPQDTDPWRTLLWAAGRGDLDGFERRGPDWSWHSAPLEG